MLNSFTSETAQENRCDVVWKAQPKEQWSGSRHGFLFALGCIQAPAGQVA